MKHAADIFRNRGDKIWIFQLFLHVPHSVIKEHDFAFGFGSKNTRCGDVFFGSAGFNPDLPQHFNAKESVAILALN